MPAISSLTQKLAANYPSLTFFADATAHWSAETRTVHYDAAEPHADWILLHETSHALLGHTDYMRDIDLLKIEREAWNYAVRELAPQYDITIDPEFIETQLDTYRDWLHAKSTCPTCESSGVETQKHQYTCLHCSTTWQTNTGIDVGIRRYIIA